ncbi:MAG TPA: hypothetical protein DCF49_02145 [Lachnospiraceae bacterium]|nr:hypothetical protein [Lachnospiraceae bacterium]
MSHFLVSTIVSGNVSIYDISVTFSHVYDFNFDTDVSTTGFLFQKAQQRMSDLLSYLTGNLKKNGMTVDDFCRQIGISRQKFYRYVKEPRRFTEEKIRSIIDVLSLDGAQIDELESYLYPSSKRSLPAQHRDLNSLIAEIFKRRLAGELSKDLLRIEYTNTDGTVSMETVDSLTGILSGENVDPLTGALSGETVDPLTGTLSGMPAGASDSQVPPSGAREHTYDFTIYNCIPPGPDASPGVEEKPSDHSILTIACIINALDDRLSRSGSVHIHVRHYLSEAYKQLIVRQDIDDLEAMRFNLWLFNMTLPLQAAAEDYYLDPTKFMRRTWTDQSSFCLIRHTTDTSEYFLMVFSTTGDCCICRLGGEEVSHIYDFLSTDSRNRSRTLSDRSYASNPNLIYHQVNSRHKRILIHPDICIDDVPKEMWLALEEAVANSSDSALFEKAFRQLMDPFDQYSFLGFKELVSAAISTLEQRTIDNARMGKMVICHPEGLMKLVQSGIITDLSVGEVDYTGKDFSSTPLRFPTPLIRKFLEFIKESIVRRKTSPVTDPTKYDWTNYYIMHPQIPCPDTTLVIYDHYGIIPIYTFSRHKNTLINLFQSPAVGTLVYDYTLREVIEKRGEKLDSEIMSDEHSIAFLDKLISQLQ